MLRGSARMPRSSAASATAAAEHRVRRVMDRWVGVVDRGRGDADVGGGQTFARRRGDSARDRLGVHARERRQRRGGGARRDGVSQKRYRQRRRKGPAPRHKDTPIEGGAGWLVRAAASLTRVKVAGIGGD